MKDSLITALLTLTSFFLLLFLYTKLAGPIPFSVNSITTAKSDTFNVTGTGKATAVPDYATIRGGVSATGLTVALVQEQINVASNKISDAVKKSGVDPKDIQTSNYSINPTYDYTSGSQKIIGYSANTTFTIKVRDVSKAGQVIDAITLAGANNVSNLGFEVTDKTKALNEARKIAVADAKKKAADAASIAGFQLGRIVNYNESFGDYPRPVYALDAAVGGGPSEKTSVEPGSNEINLTVTLSYEIK